MKEKTKLLRLVHMQEQVMRQWGDVQQMGQRYQQAMVRQGQRDTEIKDTNQFAQRMDRISLQPTTIPMMLNGEEATASMGGMVGIGADTSVKMLENAYEAIRFAVEKTVKNINDLSDKLTSQNARIRTIMGGEAGSYENLDQLGKMAADSRIPQTAAVNTWLDIINGEEKVFQTDQQRYDFISIVGKQLRAEGVQRDDVEMPMRLIAQELAEGGMDEKSFQQLKKLAPGIAGIIWPDYSTLANGTSIQMQPALDILKELEHSKNKIEKDFAATPIFFKELWAQIRSDFDVGFAPSIKEMEESKTSPGWVALYEKIRFTSEWAGNVVGDVATKGTRAYTFILDEHAKSKGPVGRRLPDNDVANGENKKFEIVNLNQFPILGIKQKPAIETKQESLPERNPQMGAWMVGESIPIVEIPTSLGVAQEMAWVVHAAMGPAKNRVMDMATRILNVALPQIGYEGLYPYHGGVAEARAAEQTQASGPDRKWSAGEHAALLAPSAGRGEGGENTPVQVTINLGGVTQNITEKADADELVTYIAGLLHEALENGAEGVYS